MSKPLGPGYKSDISLQIAQLPKTTDAAIFAELVEVYNSIHTLNAARQQFSDAYFNTDSELPLEQQMVFTTSLWVTASEDIAQGKICKFIGTGARMGHNYAMTCLSLTEAVAGKPIKLGFGPAVLKIDGTLFDQKLFTHDATFRGEFLPTAIKGAIQVAYCFKDDYVLFAPNWFNTGP